MKSNKVRMNISREMHEWFTAIDGKTNDERMERVIEINDAYRDLLKAYGIVLKNKREERMFFNRMLALSIAVSTVSVGYLAYAQGWFL